MKTVESTWNLLDEFRGTLKERTESFNKKFRKRKSQATVILGCAIGIFLVCLAIGLTFHQGWLISWPVLILAAALAFVRVIIVNLIKVGRGLKRESSESQLRDEVDDLSARWLKFGLGTIIGVAGFGLMLSFHPYWGALKQIPIFLLFALLVNGFDRLLGNKMTERWQGALSFATSVVLLVFIALVVISWILPQTQQALGQAWDSFDGWLKNKILHPETLHLGWLKSKSIGRDGAAATKKSQNTPTDLAEVSVEDFSLYLDKFEAEGSVLTFFLNVKNNGASARMLRIKDYRLYDSEGRECFIGFPDLSSSFIPQERQDISVSFVIVPADLEDIVTLQIMTFRVTDVAARWREYKVSFRGINLRDNKQRANATAERIFEGKAASPKKSAVPANDVHPAKKAKKGIKEVTQESESVAHPLPSGGVYANGFAIEFDECRRVVSGEIILCFRIEFIEDVEGAFGVLANIIKDSFKTNDGGTFMLFHPAIYDDSGYRQEANHVAFAISETEEEIFDTQDTDLLALTLISPQRNRILNFHFKNLPDGVNTVSLKFITINTHATNSDDMLWYSRAELFRTFVVTFHGIHLKLAKGEKNTTTAEAQEIKVMFRDKQKK